jgi:hypothetical protein
LYSMCVWCNVSSKYSAKFKLCCTWFK